MWLICFGLSVLLIALASPAQADLLRAKRASFMCSSAGALAKLALPGGGSRDIGVDAPAEVTGIARGGNCIPFYEGHIVSLEKARKRTSIVRSDSLSGDGVMIEVLVANIDYGPYVPPHDVFYDTIRARCPGLLESFAAEDPPRRQFVESLPPPLRTSIDRAMDDTCGPAGDCLRHASAVEIDRRHLAGQWAAFLCAYPKAAIEPEDQSAGPVRD
jgi:hypothetical protein